MGGWEKYGIQTITDNVDGLLDVLHAVPNRNSNVNLLIRDCVGNKNDFVTIPYSFGVNSLVAHANTIYQHVHGQSWVYPKFSNGVMLTTAGSAYTDPGLPTEIIPANTLTSPFDIHFAFLYNLSSGGEFVVELYSGAPGEEILIEDGLFAYRDTSGRVQLGNQRSQIPQQIANTRISAKAYFSGNSVQTVQVRLKGHYYA